MRRSSLSHLNYIPRFYMGSGSAGTQESGYLAFNNVYLNVGNHFNNSSTQSSANNRFTAPVKGDYYFHFHGFLDEDNNSTQNQAMIYVNGADHPTGIIRNYTTSFPDGSYGPGLNMMATLALEADDYVQIYSSFIMHGNNGYWFGGNLVG